MLILLMGRVISNLLQHRNKKIAKRPKRRLVKNAANQQSKELLRIKKAKRSTYGVALIGNQTIKDAMLNLFILPSVNELSAYVLK